jgi:hypothetical protein
MVSGTHFFELGFLRPINTFDHGHSPDPAWIREGWNRTRQPTTPPAFHRPRIIKLAFPFPTRSPSLAPTKTLGLASSPPPSSSRPAGGCSPTRLLPNFLPLLSFFTGILLIGSVVSVDSSALYSSAGGGVAGSWRWGRTS